MQQLKTITVKTKEIQEVKMEIKDSTRLKNHVSRLIKMNN